METGLVHLSHDRRNAACGVPTASADELTTDTAEVTCRDCCDVDEYELGDEDEDEDEDEDTQAVDDA